MTDEECYCRVSAEATRDEFTARVSCEAHGRSVSRVVSAGETLAIIGGVATLWRCHGEAMRKAMVGAGCVMKRAPAARIAIAAEQWVKEREAMPPDAVATWPRPPGAARADSDAGRGRLP